jgi:hypothetical protein
MKSAGIPASEGFSRSPGAATCSADSASTAAKLTKWVSSATKLGHVYRFAEFSNSHDEIAACAGAPAAGAIKAQGPSTHFCALLRLA